MEKIMRRCKHCQCLFEVCKKVKKHEYCRQKKCQQARKRKWHQGKLKEDETYRKDQKIAQQDWLKKNPDYWKRYRRRNKKYTEGNRKKQCHRNRIKRINSSPPTILEPIAKMDALSSQKRMITGRYRLIPIDSEKFAKMDTLIVEIATISSSFTSSGGMVAKMDV